MQKKKVYKKIYEDIAVLLQDKMFRCSANGNTILSNDRPFALYAHLTDRPSNTF